MSRNAQYLTFNVSSELIDCAIIVVILNAVSLLISTLLLKPWSKDLGPEEMRRLVGEEERKSD